MIRFHPRKGTVLCCDFSQGFEPPEMIKIRPVVVFSPQLPGRNGLCTVVPLSTVKPETLQPFHHAMNPASLTPKMQQKPCWAKCDMLYTVGFKRLDRVREKASNGKRLYLTSKVTPEDMQAIEIAVLNGLGLRRYLE